MKLREEQRRKEIYGLGSEGKSYYGSKKFIPYGSNASSSVFQPTPITNMSEFVMQLIPALTDHFLLVVLERVHEVNPSPPTNNPSAVTLVVPPATTNVEEEDHLVSDDDRCP
ncbi:hypothetical protein AABB24_038472 [Solanum stoloniferum]|uniref:Uncharacterized protein n=1 Tax=Solanum stoloniferum TaxID=62892 RepID=A0ABD2R053_9SOLN